MRSTVDLVVVVTGVVLFDAVLLGTADALLQAAGIKSAKERIIQKASLAFILEKAPFLIF